MRGDRMSEDEDLDEDLQNPGFSSSASYAAPSQKQRKVTANAKLRAINTWLSVELRQDFATLGDQLSRAQLDTLRGSNLQRFWFDAAKLYNTTAAELGVLQHDHELFENMDFDPSTGEALTAKQMFTVYKEVLAQYRAVDAACTRSGYHQPFEKYVNGRLVALYFHLCVYRTMKTSLGWCVRTCLEGRLLNLAPSWKGYGIRVSVALWVRSYQPLRRSDRRVTSGGVSVNRHWKSFEN
eukprot:GHVU01009722.1.p1 GENE.GHVU01009722.1~~GHVU01009722.1.p1  ORF type:complete len:238 (+),score=24.97 GHVU01009722.1:1400-2113(+)